jgi:hypothetical protein
MEVWGHDPSPSTKIDGPIEATAAHQLRWRGLASPSTKIDGPIEADEPQQRLELRLWGLRR